jgi:hypothetical protein
VWLLKRELARGGKPAVLDAFQCAEFDGTTLTATPAWGGPFAVDVVACVAEPSGGTFWIKAQNRSVQVCAASVGSWRRFSIHQLMLCRPLWHAGQLLTSLAPIWQCHSWARSFLLHSC